MGQTKNSAKKSVDSLILGTAQFGLPYGIANNGKLDINQAQELLDLAYELGIRELDTASAYGTSEEVLGFCGMDRWSIITKVPSMVNVKDRNITKETTKAVNQSLERLKVNHLNAVLAHDYRDTIGERGRRFLDGIAPFLTSGQISKVGVSVYSPEDLDGLIQDAAQIVQAPLNVFDQRFTRPDVTSKLYDIGAEFHVRSVFLQGLLLMSKNTIPSCFDPWKAKFLLLEKCIHNSRLDPVAFCLGFPTNFSTVKRCVIGANSAEQLTDTVNAFKKYKKVDYSALDLGSNDCQLIDPRKWNYTK